MFIDILGGIALCMAIGLPLHLIAVGVLQIYRSSFERGKTYKMLISRGYIALIAGSVLLTIAISAVVYMFFWITV